MRLIDADLLTTEIIKFLALYLILMRMWRFARSIACPPCELYHSQSLRVCRSS